MTVNPRFGARDYAQRCPVCGWVDPKPPAWEEGFSRAHHCPFDGTPLETLACAECGAPAFTTEAYTLAGPMTVVGRHCPECGGAVTRREPKMITHWKPKNAPTITKLGPDGRPVKSTLPEALQKWDALFTDKPVLHDVLHDVMRAEEDKTPRRIEKSAAFAAAYGSEQKDPGLCADCKRFPLTADGRDLRVCCGQARCQSCHELHIDGPCPEQP